MSARLARRGSRVASSVLACALAGLSIAAGGASARPSIYTYDSGAPVAHRSPKGAPLRPPAGADGGGGATEAQPSMQSAIVSSSSGDPLAGNGLGSPLCGGGAASSELSAAAARNCASSSFDAASAPIGNYGFDVNIDTGRFGLAGAVLGNGGAALQTMLQEVILAPAWNGLVWLTHALIAVLEWCYTIDLIDSPAMGGVGQGLRQAQATFTQPWLVAALAVAAVLTLYHGLVRRRVAETLGQALLVVAMTVGGLWVIANPTGTVGELGRWANEAGLGTLATVSDGTPNRPGGALSRAMQGVFDAAIGKPWCYLEFGNVSWCSDPARVDPRLRGTAQAIAGVEQLLIGCPMDTGPTAICVKRGSRQARVLAKSAALLRQARTNGELFLALPANSDMRNSIGLSGSLLNVLCGGAKDAAHCQGPTVEEAAFRTGSGTNPRVAGLVLIAIGSAGMMLMLGFLALHLLSASLTSLVYLLLAPAAVLAPALGDGGRAVFRRWATRLLGAVTSKLIFSFLLGTILTVARIVMGLQGLGWWIRWLLLAGLWWGAFQQRHQVLGFAQGQPTAHGGAAHERRSLVRRVKEAYETPLTLARFAGRMKTRRQRPAPEVERQRPAAIREHSRRDAGARIDRRRLSMEADGQIDRLLAGEHAEAAIQAARAPRLQDRIAAGESRLERIRSERARAQQGGDGRRAARLGFRGQRVEGEIARDRQALANVRRGAAGGEGALGRDGRMHTPRKKREERARFLDAQAALPGALHRARAESIAGARGTAAGRAGEVHHGPGVKSGGEAGRPSTSRGRDYAALAGLLGYARSDYERLDAASRRRARLEIDRQLARRRELHRALAGPAQGGSSGTGHREQRRHAKDSGRASARPEEGGGESRPSQPAPPDPWQIELRRRAGRSPVMRDVREVAQGRKRQLGWRERR